MTFPSNSQVVFILPFSFNNIFISILLLPGTHICPYASHHALIWRWCWYENVYPVHSTHSIRNLKLPDGFLIVIFHFIFGISFRCYYGWKYTKYRFGLIARSLPSNESCKKAVYSPHIEYNKTRREFEEYRNMYLYAGIWLAQSQ